MSFDLQPGVALSQAIAQINADRRAKGTTMTAVDEVRLSQDILEAEAKGAALDGTDPDTFAYKITSKAV